MDFLWNLLLQAETPEGKTFGQQMAEVLVLYVFPALLAVAFIWVIWVGFHLAKAKDEAERRQAKERFFKAFAGLFIIGILYIIMATMKVTIIDPK